jgi:hypothetical protein
MTVTLHLSVYTLGLIILVLIGVGYVLCDTLSVLNDRKAERQAQLQRDEQSHLDWMHTVVQTPPREDLTDPNLTIVPAASLVLPEPVYVEYHPCVWCDGNIADVSTMHGYGFCSQWEGDPFPVSPAPVGRHYAREETSVRHLVSATVSRSSLPGTPTGEYRILEM